MVRERNQEAEPDYPNACWFLKNMDPLMSHHYNNLHFFLKKTSQIRKQKFLKYGIYGELCELVFYVIFKGQQKLFVFPPYQSLSKSNLPIVCFKQKKRSLEREGGGDSV